MSDPESPRGSVPAAVYPYLVINVALFACIALVDLSSYLDFSVHPGRMMAFAAGAILSFNGGWFLFAARCGHFPGDPAWRFGRGGRGWLALLGFGMALAGLLSVLAAAAAGEGIGIVVRSDFETARVRAVLRGYGAERAGLRPGDELLYASDGTRPVDLRMRPGSDIRRFLGGRAGTRVALAWRRGRDLLFASVVRDAPVRNEPAPDPVNRAGTR